ncbi:MAG: RNA polymerase factor sigma-54 [Rhodospirillales bacterium]|nr:MAG: RNA polymerase factor sigma-54 [Rhodospirillales bacterium]
MAIGPRLVLGQRQSLVMTPQLQQAIKLLQLSQLELAAYIASELESNPLLAEAPRDDEAPVAEPVAAAPEPAAAPADSAAAIADGATALGEADDRWEGEYRDAGGDGTSTRGETRRDDGDERPDSVARIAAGDISLQRHVLAQIALELTDPADRTLAVRLVDLLDETGYLAEDPAPVAAALGMSAERLEAVLARLRRLDPPGLFSRGLAECLAAQLEERDRLDPAMRALLDNLDLLARRDLAGLSRRCGVDAEDVADMLAEIRTLDPKPGLRFGGEPARAATPDVFLRRVRHAELGEVWMVELNTDALPRVLADRGYFKALVRGARDKSEKEFVGERWQNANWLVKALEQRATTILKVSREIVAQQDAFFRHGVTALRPLVLRDIAAATGLHESTVSRVTTNKFMATPRGTFELKYFFTSAIPATRGAESVSAEAVRARIRGLVDGERADAPVSDDRLVELLREQGVEIARRTVAKYREAMRIPSSVQRRREKTFAGHGSAAQAAAG